MLVVSVVLVGLVLAYANGANDNIKGAATLIGSRTLELRPALWMATGATLVGSVGALFIARGLLLKFTGKGLVPPEVVADPAFAVSVALAAGLTVLAATRMGMPISTTHALIGALMGAGILASPSGLATAGLVRGLLLPLLSSPLLAIVLAGLLYTSLRALRRRTGITRETCVCVTSLDPVAGAATTSGVSWSVATAPAVGVTIAPDRACREVYRGRLAGVSAEKLVDVAHLASALAVSFARGLNDTPKIAALLLVGGAVGQGAAVGAVAVAIALGGLLSAWRVARTMSFEVTEMNPGQGLSANLTTAALVIGASRLGLPVSTTHVSCGSLFGIGQATDQAKWGKIRQIALAWLLTLPLAAALGTGIYAVVR